MSIQAPPSPVDEHKLWNSVVPGGHTQGPDGYRYDAILSGAAHQDEPVTRMAPEGSRLPVGPKHDARHADLEARLARLERDVAELRERGRE